MISAELSRKSSVAQIRAEFDADVERFSKLETGQQALIDAPLVLDLVSQAAASQLQPGMSLLDVGCGAGNYTLSVLARVAPLNCTLADLSEPMLQRARERIGEGLARPVNTLQSDMRNLNFAENQFDVILAGAVLHHLRDDEDWKAMFERLHRWLRPGGLLLVADLIAFDDPTISELMWRRYCNYLDSVGGEQYRRKVIEHIDAEDSPRSLQYQLELARSVGFRDCDTLHRNSIFATYYARK